MGPYAIALALGLNALTYTGVVPGNTLRVKNVNNNEVVVFVIRF
jgi:hypothetical protein